MIDSSYIEKRWTHSCKQQFSHLSGWNFLSLSVGRVYFKFSGCRVFFFFFFFFFHFFSNLKRNFCKQTAENLIRRSVLWRLICFCTVCRCPIKRTLCLYGLIAYINCTICVNVNQTYKLVAAELPLYLLWLNV